MVALCWLLLSCTDSVGTEDSGLWTTPTDSATEPTRGPVQRDDHAHVYPDADRDGWTSDRDCDDQDPWTHPWAAEWCDPVDHDCDGEPLAEGVCGKVQTLEAIQSTWIGGDRFLQNAELPVFAGDLDGEAGEELLVWTWHNPDGGNYTYKSIAVISEVPEPGASITDVATSIVMADCCNWDNWRGAGDFDGDGLGDVILNAEEVAVEGYAETYLILGPPDDWAGVNRVGDIADQIWLTDYQSEDNHGTLKIWDVGGDLDGDGRDEVAITGSFEHAGSVLLWGRADLPGGELSSTEEMSLENHRTPWGITEDLDGDGISDLVYTSYKFSWASGADVPTEGLFDWESVDVRSSLPDSSRCAIGANPDQDEVLHIGDWSGDGVEDLLYICDEEVSLEGEPSIHVIDGAQLPISEPGYDPLDLSLGSWQILTTTEEFGIGIIQVAGDVDQDGLPDIAYGAFERPGGESVGYIRWLRSELGMPEPLTPASRDYQIGALGAERGLWWVIPGTTGDLDGDGRVDLATSLEDPNDDPNQANYDTSVHIILGWDLPWHDPTYF